MNAAERAINDLQEELSKTEATRDAAISLLREINNHTRLTDKDRMRFTSEYPEDLYDRFNRFLRGHKEES